MMESDTRRLVRKAEMLFFVSGLSSLIVETVLAKLLGYILGITAHATAVVLAAFMAGLAAGSWLIGKYSEALRQPIRVYGTLELIVGLYAFTIPFIYPILSSAVPALISSQDVSSVYFHLYRYVISTVVVVVPATVMGGTLPLLARGVVNLEGLHVGRLPRLYFINTLGAATGVFLATYFTNFFIGLRGSLWLVTLFNLFIFLRSRNLVVGSAAIAAHENVQTRADFDGTLSGRFVLLLLFSTGATAFFLENLWTHALASLVGMSVYAFGAMLGTLLLGIAIGAAQLPLLRRRIGDQTSLVSLILVTNGVYIAGTLVVWDRVPELLPFVSYLNPGFFVMEAARLIVCVALILVPSMCMGAAFPLLLELFAASAPAFGKKVGIGYAWNTSGGIAGSLLAGFVLIGWLPTDAMLRGIAIIMISLGLIVGLVASRAGAGTEASVRYGLCVVGIVLAVLVPGWNLDKLTAGTWLTFTSQTRGEMIAATEDVSTGFITIHETPSKVIQFFNNGKYEASYPTPGFQKNHALIPSLFLGKGGRALEIGLGGGGTLGVLYKIGFDQIDVVELAAKMIDMARTYNQAGAMGAFESPRVALYVADGRNWLQQSKEKYDLIVIEISTVWFADAGNLFNREFYELARSHLRAGGIISTYLQLKQLNHEDLLLAINTMRRVFPHVAYFNAGEQGYLLGSMRALEASYARIQQMNNDPNVQPLLDYLPEHDLFNLLGGKLLYFPDEFAAAFGTLDKVPLIRDLFQSTDLHPLAEYGTPRGVSNRLAYEANFFRLYSASNIQRMPTVTGVPSLADALAIAGAYHVGRAAQSKIPDMAAAELCYEAALSLRDEPLWRERLEALRAKSDPAKIVTSRYKSESASR